MEGRLLVASRPCVAQRLLGRGTLVVVLAATAIAPSKFAAVARAEDERPTFAVWYAPGAPDDFATLRAVLGDGRGARVERFESATEWMASSADVLVLRGSDNWPPFPLGYDERHAPPDDYGPLKGRRVLGIGIDAGAAFEDLGLDIRGDTRRAFLGVVGS
jgi:hypothetical protein